MNKLKIFMSCIIFAACINFGISVNAANGSMSIKAGHITAENEDSITVPITVDNNSGICGATIAVSYDSRLTLLGLSSGSAFTSMTMTKPGDLAENPIKILWDGIKADSSNGDIVYLTFANPAKSGTYSIEISYDEGDIIDQDLNPVLVDVEGGSIEIKSQSGDDEKEKEDQAAAQTVTDIINQIDVNDKATVEAAREAYNALTEDQKNWIADSVLKKLTDAEKAIEEAEEKEKEDQTAAQSVINAINQIDVNDPASVKAARVAYDALTADQKKLVADSVLKKLTDAEKTIEEATEEANQKAADDVTDIINKMDTSDQNSVKAARAAYDALTADQKKLVADSVLKKLTDAEQIHSGSIGGSLDQELAQTVTNTINQMDVNDPASVEAARAAYDALTLDQQELVEASALKKLEIAEQAIQEAKEKQKEDQKAADSVTEAINKMDPSDSTSVEEAKKAYDALTPDQKKLVDPAIVEQLEKAVKENSKVLVASIKLTGISNKIAAGKKIQLQATVLPVNATNTVLKWTSSNTKVATVNQSGLVVLKKKTGGKYVKITATATDGSGKQAVFTIKVMKGAVTKITIKGSKKTLKTGKTMKLRAVVKKSKGTANKKIKWTSSNPEYATVSTSGKVKALKAGKGKKVKITAMATDGSGKKKTVTIKIK